MPGSARSARTTKHARRRRVSGTKPEGLRSPRIAEANVSQAGAGKGALGVVDTRALIQGEDTAPESWDREDRFPGNAQRRSAHPGTRATNPQRHFPRAP